MATLGMLFGALLVAYWIVRGKNPEWGSGLPAMPVGMWGAGAILVCLSGVAEAAWRLRASGGFSRLMSLIALVFSVVFLAVQYWNWAEMTAADLPPNAANLYAFTFYTLTGLHALHVVGGVIYQILVTQRHRAGDFDSGGAPALRNAAKYWHFLLFTWVILFGSMLASADHAEGGAIFFLWVGRLGGPLLVLALFKAVRASGEQTNLWLLRAFLATVLVIAGHGVAFSIRSAVAEALRTAIPMVSS